MRAFDPTGVAATRSVNSRGALTFLSLKVVMMSPARMPAHVTTGRAYYGPGCYAGPRQCGWAGRSCWRNPYGETVCHGGEWRCWRPTVCN